MIRPLTLVLLFCHILFHQAAAQTTITAIDKQLAHAYQVAAEAPTKSRHGSAASTFTRLLKKHLSNPVTLEQSLDSLSTLITIVPSADKKVKLYSWTENTADDYFLVHGFMQYKTGPHTVSYTPLETSKEYPYSSYGESQVFEVAEIRQGSKVYYLTFAWGSYGSGKQHKVAQLYTLEGSKLVACRAFPGNEKKLVLTYPRRYGLNMSYNEKTRSLSFDEFEFDDDSGFSHPTGGQKTLVFKNGVFQ